MNLIPIIISGGSGSRLWPLSTKKKPKPFIDLFSDKNLLDKTITRLQGISQQIFFICNQSHLALHQQAMQNKNIRCSFLLEKEGRNTAPAILMAARVLEQQGLNDAIMLVLPADQFILEKEKFQQSVQIAAQQAQKKGLVTFGIKPSYPETGYGYLCLEEKIEPIVHLKKFIEKPSLEKAQKFLQQKNYFWNSGIFCFSVQSILEAFEKHQPQMIKISLEVLQKSIQKENQFFFDSQSFQKFPSISIDYAIMEKHSDVFAVCTDFHWSDIGSWFSVAKLFAKDKQGNNLQGNYFGLENQNTFLLAKNNFFGLLGLQNISIIESEQGILIAHNSKLQEVKKIFEYVYQKPQPMVRKIYNSPEILEINIASMEKYTLKIQQDCSIVNVGLDDSILTVNQKKVKVRKNDSIFLPKKIQITFKNHTTQEQKWIKIQTNEKKELLE